MYICFSQKRGLKGFLYFLPILLAQLEIFFSCLTNSLIVLNPFSIVKSQNLGIAYLSEHNSH